MERRAESGTGRPEAGTGRPEAGTKRPEADTGTAGGVSHRMEVTKLIEAGGRHNCNHFFPIIPRPRALVVPPSEFASKRAVLHGGEELE